MSEKGVLQLYQTDFTRYENTQTRLQGVYKLRIINIHCQHPEGGSGNDSHFFNVDIQQLSHLLDNSSKLSFIYNNGTSVVANPLHFNETFINGQINWSGLNMGNLTGLLITIEYEKCDKVK